MPIKIGPFYLGPPSASDRAAVEASAISLPFSFPHVCITRTAPPLPEPIAAEGWTLDHHRVKVGQGKEGYRKAQRILQQWRHFNLGWASVNSPPVKPGSPVVVTAHTLMCWSCNPLRISFAEECPLRRDQQPPWAALNQKRGSGGSSGRQQAQQAQQQGGSSGSRGGGSRAAAEPADVQAAVAVVRPPRGRRYAFAHTTLQGHQISGEERFAVSWNQEDDSVWYEIYTLSRPGSWITTLTYPLLRAFQHKFAVDSMAAVKREMLKP